MGTLSRLSVSTFRISTLVLPLLVAPIAHHQLTWPGSYALLRHPSAPINEYLLPLINGSGFFGRVLGGYFADKTGRLNLVCPMTILSGVFCLALWLSDRYGSGVSTVIAFVCLYGFTSGVFISVVPPAVAQISPDDKIGGRIGAFFMLTAVATLVGSPIAGMLVDETSQNGYTNMILFAVGLAKYLYIAAALIYGLGSHFNCWRWFNVCWTFSMR